MSLNPVNFEMLVGQVFPNDQAEKLLSLMPKDQEIRNIAFNALMQKPPELRKPYLEMLFPIILSTRASSEQEKIKNRLELKEKTDTAHKQYMASLGKLAEDLYNPKDHYFVKDAANPRNARLRAKILERKKIEELKIMRLNAEGRVERLLTDLSFGIQTITNSSFYKRNSICLTKAEAEERADYNAEELLAKSRAVRKRSPRTKKNSFTPKSPEKEVTTTREKGKEKSEPSQPIRIASETELREIFFSNLINHSSKWRERARVSRWESTNLDVIRNFEDKNSKRKIVHRYLQLDDESILKQRAKHFLRGTERLLDLQYRHIYTCPTERGFGVVAQLTYNNDKINGMLYLGCDKGCIFHRYFEEIDFQDTTKNLFRENSSETKDQSQETMLPINCEVEISEQEGIITFIYQDNYSLRVFPLRPDLLEKELLF